MRPSSARLREALLSIWGERVAGAALLDLFAGSGAVGLEGWSRGAARVVFVEAERGALAALRRNLALVDEAGATEVVAAPAATALARLAEGGHRFDLLFADPPYALAVDAGLLAALAAVAAPGAELAVEHAPRGAPPEAAGGWRRTGERRYGDSVLGFYALDDEVADGSSSSSKKNASSSR